MIFAIILTEKRSDFMQNSKYSSSKSYGSSGERYERMRDSPNGNYRSDSPDPQSPPVRDRDRSYQTKSSYIQKLRDKERENRDYKMSRDKYSGNVKRVRIYMRTKLEFHTSIICYTYKRFTDDNPLDIIFN